MQIADSSCDIGLSVIGMLTRLGTLIFQNQTSNFSPHGRTKTFDPYTYPIGLCEEKKKKTLGLESPSVDARYVPTCIVHILCIVHVLIFTANSNSGQVSRTSLL